MLEEQINLSIRDQLSIERYNTGEGYQAIAKRLGLKRELVRYYLKPIEQDKEENRRSAKNRKSRANTNKRVIWTILSRVGCEICGEKNPMVLEFDHIDPSEKTGSMSALISNGYNLDRLLDELDKCRIICANCHRIHTFEQSNSWRWDMYKSMENVSHD